MPKVSIIVPVYNAGAEIKRCVDSILTQEYQDFELFLMDDGSTDSSPGILDEYAKQDKRVRVYHKENTGVSDTRNQAMRLARGEYIQFVDADDWISSDSTKLMVRAMQESGADMAIADFYRVIGERLSRKGDIDEEGVITRKDYADEMLEDPADFYYGVLWNKLYRRDILEKYHLEMDVNLNWCEDFIFNIRVFTKAHITVIVDEPLYEYTHRENSLAHAYFKKNISQYIDNRIKRVEVTQNAVNSESDIIKHWSMVHIIMYYNELLGKVASFPELHSDKRIRKIINYIRYNKQILNSHYKLCGFSKKGAFLISFLPSSFYMRYRKTKN